MDKKKFTQALITLFISKGKEPPSLIVSKVWYELLKKYPEKKVLTAITDLCTINIPYGVQVGMIVDMVNPKRDYDYEAISLIDSLYKMIKDEAYPAQLVKDGVLTSEDFYTLKGSSSSYEKDDIKKRIMKKFKALKDPSSIYCLEDKSKKEIKELDPDILKLTSGIADKLK